MEAAMAGEGKKDEWALGVSALLSK